ncbi:MAG: hypothetical protein KGI57_09720, partial [Hyphomicrobiales bacterium]|nr:hypothetical protein [Hyphomicrobiales bacterium]
NDATLGRDKVAGLQAQLDAQGRAAAAGGAAAARLDTLVSDEATKRDLLKTYMRKYAEALAHETDAATPAEARVISPATPPDLPSFPRAVPTLIVVGLAALLISAALAALRAAFDGRGEDAVAAPTPLRGEAAPTAAPRRESPVARLRAFGLDPPAASAAAAAAPAEAAPSGLAADEAPPSGDVNFASDPAPSPDVSPAGRAALQLLSIHDGIRGLVAMVASDGDAGAAALALGRRLAHDTRVVVVALGPEVGLPGGGQGPDLADALDGGADLDAALQRDDATALHVVACRRRPADARELPAALAALAETYDFVIVATGEIGSPAAVAARSLAGAAIVSATTEASAKLSRELRDSGILTVLQLATVAPEDRAA